MKELLERLLDDFEVQLKECLQEDTTESIYQQGMYDGSILLCKYLLNYEDNWYDKWLDNTPCLDYERRIDDIQKVVDRYYSDGNEEGNNEFFRFLRNQLDLFMQMQREYEDEEYDEEDEQEYGGMEL
ncbi:hypothetical protein [uncultured Holdemanella sp.]|uniref:hypothetical protein n=1 Tax=uncultured Holdemanella sp. TaxID=1763549 RepID=UPI0025DFBA32|nr:hypothetical protein [uncultured Holdemanella sp.]